ncbi:MAG: murein biosynthesis integral membrane protein MurJ [Oscillospiraceae bacterium]|nr:murein biosynthesis integral membrane protein MurJ [Oscillospiraceae bacterium]
MQEERKKNSAVTVGVVMALTLLGKVLGLVRDMMLGHKFSTGMLSTAFLAASRIPRNFFDAIFASAISASFIPVFNEYLTRDGKREAFRLANAFITVMALATAVLSILGMVFSGELTAFFADGFDAPTAALCAKLLRVLFPSIVFTGIAFSMVGVLQSLGEFNVPAIISAVSNAVIILYYIFLCDRFGVEGLAAAFLVGWAMQALVQIPSLRKNGYIYRPCLRHEGLRKIFLLMLPVMVSTWIQPINLAVATKYASHIYEGAAVSAIEYANTLYTILVGVFVLSITNVIFPSLSKLGAKGEEEAFSRTIDETLGAMLYFLVPMTVGVAVLARPIVRLLYEWGAWDAFSTDITATALAFLSLGMIGYGVQAVLSRAYYAVQSGRMPLITGIASIVVNFALCALLAPRWGIAGLTAASSISATVPAVLLLAALKRRYPTLLRRGFASDFIKTIVCAALMGAAVIFVRDTLLQFVDGAAVRVAVVLCPTLAGIIVYFTATYLLRVRVTRTALSMLRRGR